MFQVLLADDEALARNDVRTLIPWEKQGFELCGEAYNGAMALTMIEQKPPHIAIIDVNMPEMNGVELNRIISERFPSVKRIMLSSYDDYDYVRDCLKNGAIDYLLKHRMDGTTLLAMLNKAVMELKQEAREHDVRVTHDKMVERLSPVIIRDYITDLVRGKADAELEFEAFAQSNNLYAHAVSYTAVAVKIVPFLLLTESFTDMQTNRLVQQVLDMMQMGLGDIRERTAAYVEDGSLIVVFASKERSEHAVTCEITGAMSKLQHSLEMFLNLNGIYAVGHVCGSLKQLGASYNAADRVLSTTPAKEVSEFNKPSVKTGEAPGRGPDVYNQRVSLSIEEHKQLLLAIERLDGEGVQQLQAFIFATIRDLPVHSHTVQMIISELLHIGDKALKKFLSISSEVGNEKLPLRSELGRIGSIGELEQWMQSYYAGLLQLLKQRRVTGQYSRHVSQAIQFILERYSGNISLELAAAAIGLNPSYLSRLFKEETRSTFSEYLNQVRIKVSRQLLESGQHSIKQISNQVGFTNYNYFFKVFKVLTGMTPQAYVNSLGCSSVETESSDPS